MDAPTNVYDRPANLFVAGFIGSPPMNMAQATVQRRNGGLVTALGDVAIPVPDDAQSALGKWEGKTVVVGIRPEDLHGVGSEGGSDGAVKLTATVDRVEALGANLLVYFGVDAPRPDTAGVAAALGARREELTHLGRGGTEFCAAFEPRTGIRVGDQVEVAVDVPRLQFFDPETESSLRDDA